MTFAAVTGVLDVGPKLNENGDAGVVTGPSVVVAKPKAGVDTGFGSFDPAIVVPNANPVGFVSIDGSDAECNFVTVMLPKDVCLFVERLLNDGRFDGAVVASVLHASENPLELDVFANVLVPNVEIGFSASFAIPEPDGVKSLVNGDGCCDCGFSTVAFCTKEIGVALVGVGIANDGFERLPKCDGLAVGAGLDTGTV